MRAVLFVAMVTLAFAPSAFAQSPLEGPLAAPDVARPVKPAKAKPGSRKTSKTAHRATPRTAEPDSALPSAEAQPVAGAHSSSPAADPLSFGMKWNGSNDTARDTRIQNYDGSAAGTGAEVGMKLHF